MSSADEDAFLGTTKLARLAARRPHDASPLGSLPPNRIQSRAGGWCWDTRQASSALLASMPAILAVPAIPCPPPAPVRSAASRAQRARSAQRRPGSVNNSTGETADYDIGRS